MNTAVLVLFVINFGFIGILPRIFFKSDGKFNLMWWATAAPYLASTATLIAAWAGWLHPATGYGTELTDALGVAAGVFSAASMCLIAYTLGTHRQRIALWHQTNDAPQSIVTYGAYSRIRHPFYSSFLLALIGAVIFCPHPLTAALLAYGVYIMNHTAAKEERKLSASQFGAEYTAYIARTGRFFPRLGAPHG
jgi:protein-S-isoprenylcysteine O-methyltransferase Ste14